MTCQIGSFHYLAAISLIILLHLGICLGLTLPKQRPQVINHQGSCQKGNFECDGDKCIPTSVVCDGKYDCSDHSDEIFEVCGNKKCGMPFFQCNYGACVQPDTPCNGVQDCVDNSDESPSLCGVIERPEMEGCTLPPQPKNGSYTINGVEKSNNISVVEVYTELEFLCDTSFSLSHNYDVICLGNNEWSVPSIPECRSTCPALVSQTVDINCVLQGEETDCSRNLFVGTIAYVHCKEFYFLPIPGMNDIPPPYNTLKCQRDGSWDNNLLGCILKPIGSEGESSPVECGKQKPKGLPAIINGKDVEVLGEYPWHVGIYKKQYSEKFGDFYSQSCGGSIIHAKIVITAAHCFDDSRDPLDYGVTAGNLKRAWGAKNDTFAQQRFVLRIEIMEQYKGLTQKYAYDMALVILTEPFELNVFVALVCVDWYNTFEAQALTNGSVGYVTGWGRTNRTSYGSNDLKFIDLTYVDYGTCYNFSGEEFRGYILDDKICAGRKDEKNVCQGDSGGGFVIKTGDSFYVRAIVSIVPIRAGHCDAIKFATFTRLTVNYLRWINQIYKENIDVQSNDIVTIKNK